MTPIEVLRERVERGAAFLDEHEPRWWKRIDEERLRLRSDCNCVLGQLYGSYGDFVMETELGFSWSEEHGFDRSSGGDVLDYCTLDTLWLEAIAQRKNQGDMA